MPPGGVTEAFSYLRSNPIALVFGLVASLAFTHATISSYEDILEDFRAYHFAGGKATRTCSPLLEQYDIDSGARNR